MDPPRLSIIGTTNWRDSRKAFGLRQFDRHLHFYAIGQTGSGKTTLIENLVFQDLRAGHGLAFIDPHGDAVGRVGKQASRSGRTLVLDAPSSDALGFNPLEAVPIDQRALAASGMVEGFKNVWGQWWGPRLEHIFRNSLLTLLDQPKATLADLPRLFSDKTFRRRAIENVVHAPVRDFWLAEFEKMTLRMQADALGPLRNKLGAFLSQPSLYRILAKEKSDFDCREIMDNGQVLLVNLAKGKMGADASSLLGSLLVTRFGLAALSRADTPEAQRRDFFLYLDEFQNFTTLSTANMLSELRKYHVGLILAHQYMAQVEPEIREAILGNAGTLVAFRVGPSDARVLSKYFEGVFSELDLMTLPNHHIYVRLMVDGEPVRPFSGVTLPPLEEEKHVRN